MNKKVLSSIADFTHLLLTGKQTSGALLPPADWSVNHITNVTDIREVRKLGLKFFFKLLFNHKIPIYLGQRTYYTRSCSCRTTFTLSKALSYDIIYTIEEKSSSFSRVS